MTSSFSVINQQAPHNCGFDMVLILDGNTEHVAHASTKKNIFLEKKKIRFFTALDLVKCPEQIKQQKLIFPCMPIS